MAKIFILSTAPLVRFSCCVYQYFQTSVTTEHRSQVGKMYGDVRDTFKLGVKQGAPHSHTRNSMTHGNVTITAVAWSPPQIVKGGKASGGDSSGEETKVRYHDSLVAAAGSNGVIAVWNAKQAFFSEGSGESSTLANQQPEAILSQEHTRAVNSLAWHPKRPGIILTASQVSNAQSTRHIISPISNSFGCDRMRRSSCGSDAKLYQNRDEKVIPRNGSVSLTWPRIRVHESIHGFAKVPLNQKVKQYARSNGASSKTMVRKICSIIL